MTSSGSFAKVLLGVVGSGFLVAYALPLLFAPLRWARWLGWELPQGSKDLTVYLGRCVGALALVVTGLTLRAALAPSEHLDTVDLLIGTGALMTGVHVRGALERSQPKSETYEIVLYFTLTALLGAARVSVSG